MFVDDSIVDFIKVNQPYWQMYKGMVRLLASIFNKVWFPNEYLDGVHVIDHKFSVAEAFCNYVPVKVVANRNNLEVITAKVNIEKGASCSIGLDELYASVVYDEQYVRMVDRVTSAKDIETIERWQAAVRSAKGCHRI